MSKYNNFEDFMQSVINEADRKCRNQYGKSLTEALDVAANTITIVMAIIRKGWWILVALVAILALGPIGFSAAVIAFGATPAGIAVLAILAALGVGGMKVLYKNRILPIIVKEVGEYYKSEFNNHRNESYYIDCLIDRASDRLLNKAIGRR